MLNEGVQDWETGEMVVPASVGVYDVETAVFTEVMQFDSANHNGYRYRWRVCIRWG